jgi:MSHA biogenesis protein MshQ
MDHERDRPAAGAIRPGARACELHGVAGQAWRSSNVTDYRSARRGRREPRPLSRAITRASRFVAAVAALAAALLSPAPALAQIALRGAASAGVASAGDILHVGNGGSDTRNNCGSINPSIPGGAAGDVLIALVNARENGATVTMAGWTQIYADQYPGLPGTEEMKVFIFWRFATGGDPNTVTQSGTCSSIAAQITRFSGVDPVQPFENAPIPAGNVVRQSSGSLDTGTETTTLNGSMLLVAAFVNDNRNVSEGAGWSQSFDSALNLSRDLGLSLHYQLQATAGAVSVSGWDLAGGGSDANYGIIFALRPTGLRIAVPAGTVANDVMVASIAWRDAPIVIAPPAGWTLVRETVQAGGGGGTSRLATYIRVAGGAEPASYLWTFSNGTSIGAVGGIVSFSGVDVSVPANIVNGENGAATASGASHTAPGVTTTVAGTMLVGSFELDSSTSDWTAPLGMTETVDVASLPTPNDLGISLQMAHEVQAVAGASGPRTATASTVGANADQGAAHLLALRPAVVIVTPGSFNAFETGTLPNPGATVGDIHTKIAGAAFNLDVVSISAGVQQVAFNDQVIVELLGNNTLGVALDVNNCPTSSTLVQTIASATITGGRSAVAFAAVPDSWRDVRVRVSWPIASPTVMSCSTDNFAIRPASITVSAADADWATAGGARTLDNTAASGGAVHKAGQPFRVTALPQPGSVTQYAGSPTINSAACLALAGMTGCSNGTLTVPAGGWSGAGARINDTVTYAEAGAFTLILEDAGFASVDNDDAGITVAERVIPQTAAVQVGRFVPDRFAVAPANSPQFQTFGAACAGARSFTYMGQTFGYVTTPVALVTAQNAAGGTTANYRESLWKITTAAPSDVTQAYSNATGPALDVSQATNAPAVLPANNGTGTVTVSAADRIAHARPAAPLTPFSADISLTITVRDDSEADGQIITPAPTPFASIAFDSGADFRYGRLAMTNANGSQLVPLPVPMETQHWNGTSFVTNTADNCTTVAAGNVGLGNYSGLAAGDTTPAIAGAFTAGRRTLTLSAPGGTKSGTVDVVINLNAAAGAFNSCVAFGAPAPSPAGADLEFLRGRWCGASYDRDPTVRARFGVYKGTEEVIHIRENF